MRKRRINQSAASPVSHDVIVDAIRQEIIEGRVQPGARLPTYDVLQRRFGTTRKTVRRACDRLTSMGYVHSRPKIGTYVSDTPPHLCRYAIAFPSRPDGTMYWTDWWTILGQAARDIARSEPPKQIVEFYDISGHADVEDYQRLVGDVRTRRLAGIIFLTPPFALYDTPLSEECLVPRVYVGNATGYRKMPSVAPDGESFINRAIEFAAGQSRRRPVLIGIGGAVEAQYELWSSACQRHGITPERSQLLYVPLTPPEAARHLIQVLMRLPSDSRPDTIVVWDDHLVTEITAALLSTNLNEADRPMVIAHTNFPKIPRALLPVTFLGFDSVETVRTCINVLDAQRRGEAVAQLTLLPAMFASEQTDSYAESGRFHRNPPASREGAKAQGLSHSLIGELS